MHLRLCGLALGVLVAALLPGASATAQADRPGSPGAAKGTVSVRLLELADGAPATNRPRRRASARGLVERPVSAVRDGYVAIEAVSRDADAGALLRELEALGLRDGSAYRALAAGMFPIDRMDALRKLPGLRHARAAPPPRRHDGSVVSQGDRALGTDDVRALTGLTGAGRKVGILSDSYDALGGAAAGVASGDLPAEGVEVLDDLRVGDAPDELPTEPGQLIDEGRAMAEIVHDVAPGSAIAFHTAARGLPDFALAIEELAAAGCDVIVDDISYFTEPYFSPGIVAQAVDRVARDGVAVFSAAGNLGADSFEQPFRNSGVTFFPDELEGEGAGQAHDFGGGDLRKSMTIAPGEFVLLGLQWDDPFFSATGARGAATDLDIFAVVDDSIVAAGADFNIGADPVEILAVENTDDVPLTLDIVITKFDGPDPHVIKYINFGSPPVEQEFDMRSPTLFGHQNAEGAIAVGAAFYAETPAFDPSLETPRIEPESALGGVPILFTEEGERLRHPRVLRKPELVGPDGANTTFFPPAETFGLEPGAFDVDGDGFPNFFGTSASAPHVAAVAALIGEATHGVLPPRTIELLLAVTASDMDDPSTEGFDRGFDFKTGYGFVRADRVLRLFAGDRGALAGRIDGFGE